MQWDPKQACDLSSANLQALFDNRIPAIRIRDFATAHECRAFADSMRKRKLRYVQGNTDRPSASFDRQRIGYIGLTQFKYKLRPMGDYLQASEDSTARATAVFSESFNPVQRMIALLESTADATASIGTEGGRQYSHAISRNSNDGLGLHANYAPYQARKLSVVDATAQLAWNFYAEIPD